MVGLERKEPSWLFTFFEGPTFLLPPIIVPDSRFFFFVILWLLSIIICSFHSKWGYRYHTHTSCCFWAMGNEWARGERPRIHSPFEKTRHHTIDFISGLFNQVLAAWLLDNSPTLPMQTHMEYNSSPPPCRFASGRDLENTLLHGSNGRPGWLELKGWLAVLLFSLDFSFNHLVCQRWGWRGRKNKIKNYRGKNKSGCRVELDGSCSERIMPSATGVGNKSNGRMRWFLFLERGFFFRSFLPVLLPCSFALLATIRE